MVTSQPMMARLAIYGALLAHLQPALASFYTVSSYFVVTPTPSVYPSDCSDDCRTLTFTRTVEVDPTVTPTAKPFSSTTRTYTYDDLEVVSLYLSAGAVDESDLRTTSTADQSGRTTHFAIPITYTAPESCPTPFTVATQTRIWVPYQVSAYMSAASTATSVSTRGGAASTYITHFIPATAVPVSERPNTASDFVYTYYIQNCRNPTATGSARAAPTGSGGGRGGSGSSDWDDWDDWTVCSAMTGCVALATWVIVIATILPLLFLLGFVESYCWFRRMMIGRSALRLGTICWCLMSLWFILLTRKSQERSKEDQVLLKQYWASLSAGTKIKLWFKHGLAWRYPVELLGNPDGNNPVVVQVVPVPGQQPPGQPGDGMNGGGVDKTQVGMQQQPVYMAHSGPPQYMQPVPGQPYPTQPGVGPQGYMMPMQPQGAYMVPQPGFAPGNGQQQQQQQQNLQQMYPPYVPSVSPAQTGTTDVPSIQPTPPPGYAYQQAPPPSH